MRNFGLYWHFQASASIIALYHVDKTHMPKKEKTFQFARKKSLVDNYLRLLFFKGTLGFLWFFAWMYFVHDTPREHPTISKEELEYIETTVGKEQDHLTPKDQVQY